MSITVNVSGLRASAEGEQIVATTKIDLIRYGLVCGRPWWIAGPEVSRWTDWPPLPDGLRDFSAAELLSIRRTAILLSGYLRESRAGAPITTTPRFHALGPMERNDACARLSGAVAGQVAWSILGVPALHHIGWMGPDLGISGGVAGEPGSGVHLLDYAGRGSGPDPQWVVLTTTAAPTRALGLVQELDVGACATVRTFPGDEESGLVARLERPDLVGPGEPSGVDPERLDEQRYAPFARAMAAGISQRTAVVTGPSGEQAEVRLFPLGVTGHIGVTEDVADAIDAALQAGGAGARSAFVERVRAIQQARAGGASPSAEPAPPPRSRRRPRPVLPWTAEVDGLRHDASVGADGIVLLLPSSVVRVQAVDDRLASVA